MVCVSGNGLMPSPMNGGTQGAFVTDSNFSSVFGNTDSKSKRCLLLEVCFGFGVSGKCSFCSLLLMHFLLLSLLITCMWKIYFIKKWGEMYTLLNVLTLEFYEWYLNLKIWLNLTQCERAIEHFKELCVLFKCLTNIIFTSSFPTFLE